MNKSSDSYKVYMEKAGDATSGVLRSQPETRASLPASQDVKNAEEKSGVAIRLVRQQLGDNRKPLNKVVEENEGE
jgi:hypothetical protein